VQRRAALFLVAVLWGGVATAQQASSLGEALQKGQPSASLRHRFESVEQDGLDPAARASILRLTLGYATRPLHGVSARVEFEHVSDLGWGDAHADAGRGGRSNGVTGRPVIADPELTVLHQALLRVEALPDTTIQAGRGEIALDNERFVGPVGWRQHHQSFDTVGVINTSLARTTLRYDYVGRVHRVFGDSQPADTHLAGASVSVTERNRLGVYLYRLAYERRADAALSTLTFGGRLSGSRPVGAGRLLYEAEVAHQQDAANNPGKIDAGYYKGELGVEWRALTVRAGIEVLAASPDGGRFNTPLATLHAFNGWADKFLQTPADGLEDRYAMAAISWRGLRALGAWHLFDPNHGRGRYGWEVDLQATYQARWKQQFGAKLAVYRAEDFATDTTKVWLWSAYGF